MDIVMIFSGFLLLVAGAEMLVKGASRSAAALGISPLVIGLTIVAFGTSAPELAVSVMSGFAGQGDIALGNAVGSNIFNILLILGLSAIITPLTVSTRLVQLDVPLMIVASVMLLFFGIDGRIGLFDGAVLFAGIVSYTAFQFFKSRRADHNTSSEFEQEFGTPGAFSSRQWVHMAILILAGLFLLVMGSHWLVKGAVSIARHLGVSELIIGLTIVATGTSLPELATSVIASIRKERDIAVGNVVGSNIFNILSVIGVAGMVSPDGIPVLKSALYFDIPVMIAVAVACMPVFFSGGRIDRWEGALFLAYYIAYNAYIILSVTKSATLEEFNMTMIYFVLPLTVLSMILTTVNAIGSRKKNR